MSSARAIISFPDLTGGMRFNVTLIACAPRASIMLMIAAVLKKTLKRNLGQFLDRFGRPEKPKLFEAEEPLPPRVATALRKN